MPTTEIISPSPEVKAAIAFHEAGHAVATVLAWAEVRSPLRPPPLPVKYVNIAETAPGKWGGICYGPSVYTQQYGYRPGDWRDAMEWQLVIDMAGGIAEAIHRGERNKRDMFWFALLNCGTTDDLKDAEATLSEIQCLTGRRHGLRRFSERACMLLREHWSAVETIANILIKDDHLDGDLLDEIVNNMQISFASAA